MHLGSSLLNRQVSLVRLMLVGIVMLAGIAAGYGISVVRAQDEAQTIYACVNKWNGATRIVHPNAQCSRSEYAISWGQQGPPGTPAGFTLITNDVDLDPFFSGTLQIDCPTGMTVVDSGTIYNSGKYGLVFELSNLPVFGVDGQADFATGWSYQVVSEDTDSVPYRMWITCTEG